MTNGKICPNCKKKNAYSINSAMQKKWIKTDYYVCDVCNLKITPEHYVEATNKLLSEPVLTKEQFSLAFMYTDELMNLLVELTRSRSKSKDRAVFVQKMKDYGLGREYEPNLDPVNNFKGFLKIAWKACKQDIDLFGGLMETALERAGGLYNSSYYPQMTFFGYSVPEEDRLFYECWKMCYQELKKNDTTWDGRMGMRRIGENFCPQHIIKFGPSDMVAYMDIEDTGTRKHQI